MLGISMGISTEFFLFKFVNFLKQMLFFSLDLKKKLKYLTGN